MKSLKEALRVDLVIAVSALVVSVLAMAATWWQTRVVAQQLSAQVWPYVTVSSNLSANELRVTVRNVGLGPALVRSAVLTVDGRAQHSILDAMAAVGIRGGRHRRVDLSSLSPGEVIPAGGDVVLADVSGIVMTPASAQALATRASLAVCYCSILQNCWVTERAGDAAPRPVARCAPPGADQWQMPLNAEVLGS